MTAPHVHEHRCKPIWVAGVGPIATCPEHYRQPVPGTAVHPRPTGVVRRVATGLAVVLGLLVLSAVPAHARPGEPGDRSYRGPTTSAFFAGAHVTACLPIGVYIPKTCR